MAACAAVVAVVVAVIAGRDSSRYDIVDTETEQYAS